MTLRAWLLLAVACIACEREARVPVELDLTGFGATLVDGRLQPTVVETAAAYRRVVVAPGQVLEMHARMPHDARLRFTLEQRACTSTRQSW